MASFDFKTSYRFNIHNRELDFELHDENGMVGRHLKARGRAVVAAAKAQVGVDTGALRESIFMRFESVGRVPVLVVGSNNPIALMHHDGTRPHIIRPDKRQALRFSSTGGMVMSKLVMHPGTRPNRFLSDNLPLVRV